MEISFFLRFKKLSSNRKWAFLSFNMPWRHQICIANCLYPLSSSLFKITAQVCNKIPLPFDVRRSKTSLLKTPYYMVYDITSTFVRPHTRKLKGPTIYLLRGWGGDFWSSRIFFSSNLVGRIFFPLFFHKLSITFVLHAIFFFRQALAGNFFSKSPTPPPTSPQEFNGRPISRRFPKSPSWGPFMKKCLFGARKCYLRVDGRLKRMKKSPFSKIYG